MYCKTLKYIIFKSIAQDINNMHVDLIVVWKLLFNLFLIQLFCYDNRFVLMSFMPFDNRHKNYSSNNTYYVNKEFVFKIKNWLHSLSFVVFYLLIYLLSPKTRDKSTTSFCNLIILFKKKLSTLCHFLLSNIKKNGPIHFHCCILLMNLLSLKRRDKSTTSFCNFCFVLFCENQHYATIVFG